MIDAVGADGKRRTYKGKTSTEINQAIGHGGTIILDSEVQYSIKDSILLKSDCTLNGNGATIKLAKGLSS